MYIYFQFHSQLSLSALNYMQLDTNKHCSSEGVNDEDLLIQHCSDFFQELLKLWVLLIYSSGVDLTLIVLM